jgi:hypothetical protein
MDLGTIQELLEEARNDLLDNAVTGNIEREHHFDSTLAAYQEVKTLWRAQRILESFYSDEEPAESTQAS